MRQARWIGAGILVGVLAVGIVFLLWQSSRQKVLVPEAASDITVAATIFPLADIVQQVGGESVSVILVIPPGVSEHSYTLTPQRLQALQSAKILFQIGRGLDNRLVERIRAVGSDTQTVVVDQGINLQEFREEDEHDTGVDPHYWLMVPNAMRIAETVADELTKLDSEQGPAYTGRLAAYKNRLAELEIELQAMAREAQPKEFIAMHNAWSYFADHYGLRLVATYEPVEGKEPSLDDLARLKSLIQQYRLATFYAEPQKSSGTVSEFMQREFGLRVLTLDPVGGQAVSESYIDLMRTNMSAMVEG